MECLFPSANTERWSAPSHSLLLTRNYNVMSVTGTAMTVEINDRHGNRTTFRLFGAPQLHRRPTLHSPKVDACIINKTQESRPHHRRSGKPRQLQNICSRTTAEKRQPLKLAQCVQNPTNFVAVLVTKTGLD